MNSVAIKIVEETVNESSKKTMSEKIKATYTDELILGICTHIGSQRDKVVSLIERRLRDVYKYEVKVIKLSKYIEKYYTEPLTTKETTLAYSKLKHKIDGGDYLRKNYKSNSLLAELAIKEIREDRNLGRNDRNLFATPEESLQDQTYSSRRICYIIDSLKNKEELEVLRTVYRDIFYLFSVYTPSKERIDYLVNRAADGLSRYESEKIIATDEYEDIGDHGQNVRDTFVEADFFIRASNSNIDNVEKSVERYLHLIFNTQIITPTVQETAMYSAKSAAGNSACLSRQVGTTITDKDGVPIAQGWNDVPRFGGNLYRDTDDNNQKCYIRGMCTNVTHKDGIIEEILEEIQQELSERESNKENSLVNTKLKDKDKHLLNSIESIIRKSKFKSIIEYSRSIHAEMHAIVIGSQMTGNKMIGGDLYCTTYPCHNCARHIVLAGIKNIYYIEPYKKSLCLTLHDDSLTEDEDDKNKVRILLYDGVAPRSYLDFFSMAGDDRKSKDGKVKNGDISKAVPKKRLSLQSIPTLENQAIHALKSYGIIE